MRNYQASITRSVYVICCCFAYLLDGNCDSSFYVHRNFLAWCNWSTAEMLLVFTLCKFVPFLLFVLCAVTLLVWQQEGSPT